MSVDLENVAKIWENPSVKRLRDDLRHQENHRFVGRVEFQELLISFKKLERFVDVSARIRGLYDPMSRIKYLIEEENLFPRSA